MTNPYRYFKFYFVYIRLFTYFVNFIFLNIFRSCAQRSFITTSPTIFFQMLLGFFFKYFKYHVFAPMGRFQLELIYPYFPPSFHLTVVVSVLSLLDGRTVENESKLITF